MQILKNEVKENIEKAALTEFLESGFEKASMNKIAGRAKVSVSNIYNYYENKEELFYSIVDPVHYQIKQLLESFQENEKGESFSDKTFIEQFIRFIANALATMIKMNRNQILLLFDKSQGTKYENSTEIFISFFEAHLISASADPTNTSFILHICAKNLVEGLLEIIRYDQNDEWVNKSVNELIKYHINGTAPFFK